MFIHSLVFALIGSSCLAGSTPLLEKDLPSVTLKKHVENPKPSDHHKFDSWIVSKNPSSAKRALLTSTITTTYYPFSHQIVWYKAILSRSEFKKLLDIAYLNSSVAISSATGNYTYTPHGAFWVDFANASHFGGGFRSSGNVQEERMFDEFPILPDLAYVLRNKDTILPVASDGTAEPFVVVSALRKFDVSKVPYGNALDKASPSQVKKDVVVLNKPFNSANIIGLAAIDFSGKHNSKYSMSDLEYMTQAAFLGDVAALRIDPAAKPIINTGRWGAGAFKNSVKMVTALQILAAEMAFTSPNTKPQLIFYGIGDSVMNPIQNEIVHELQSGTTPRQILKKYLKRQESDSSWAPQN